MRTTHPAKRILRSSLRLTMVSCACMAGVLVSASSFAAEHDEAQVEEQKDQVRDPENTGINKRDRDEGKLTAFDQGSSEADRNITASIRKAIVADDSLSTNAHNVKIISVDGVVTLRGPVESPQEKSAVEAKAKSVAGVTRVDSQLEVDTD